MTKKEESNVDQALSLLSEARKILFQRLHNPEKLSQELVRGVDKLGQAIEFAENPHTEIHLCSAANRWPGTSTSVLAVT